MTLLSLKRPSTDRSRSSATAGQTPAEELTTWAEADESNDFGLLYEEMPHLDDEMTGALRSLGLAVPSCAQCADFVTDRHPRWPGVWVALGEEGGPVCHDAEDGNAWDNLFTISAYGPHRVP